MASGGSSAGQEYDWLTANVVAGICQHMNAHHAEDVLLMVRTLGGVPAASQACAIGVTAHALVAQAVVGEVPCEVSLPFDSVAQDRLDVRTQVVRLHERAQQWPGT